MTKEIIIDGCNVAECQYFNKVFNEEPYCNIDEEHLYTCDSEPNCYFKQLQRLKKENEEILKQLDFSRTHKTVLDAERIKYKHLLEKIREGIWEQNRSCDNCPDEKNGYCIGLGECASNILDNFLLKIDEVLNEK